MIMRAIHGNEMHDRATDGPVDDKVTELTVDLDGRRVIPGGVGGQKRAR